MSATKLSSQNVDQAAFDAAFTTMVKLDGVMIARGGRLLFRNVHFDVKPGTVIQLTGANGTGKTSLLRVIAGALPPADGVLTHKDSLTIAYLPADDMLWQGTRDVRASLLDWARAIGVPSANVDSALAACGMAQLASRSVAQLSMGQKRRLSWARLLLNKTDLWLLDEPFNSLDDAGLAAVRDLMARHVSAGGAIVVACHEQLPKQFTSHVVTVFDVNAVAA